MGLHKGSRFLVTMDQRLYGLLEQWADSKRMPVASLAKSILELEILDAEKKGEFDGCIALTPDASPYIAYTKAIAGVGSIDPFELQKLADSLGVDSAMMAAKINGEKNACKY
jgi:hypothetical protein